MENTPARFFCPVSELPLTSVRTEATSMALPHALVTQNGARKRGRAWEGASPRSPSVCLKWLLLLLFRPRRAEALLLIVHSRLKVGRKS